MQDKTIDNALLALRKQGGHQGKIAEVLLDMRGVRFPLEYNFKPSRCGEIRRLCKAMLLEGPKTTLDIAALLRAKRSDLGRRVARQRVYVALKRLKDIGVVRRDGDVLSTTLERTKTAP